MSSLPFGLLGALLGLAFALGVIGVVAGLRGHRTGVVEALRETSAARRRGATWWLGGLATGVVILAVTQWIAPAIAAGLVVALWPTLLGGARVHSAEIDRLEGLAAWVEQLRDQISTVGGMTEALRVTTRRPPRQIAVPLEALGVRLEQRQPIRAALTHLAEDLDSATADAVVGSLILNADAQGPKLSVVLTALAADTRAQVEARRRAGVELRQERSAVQLMIATTIVMAVGLALFQPGWAAAYQDVTGQLVMAGVVALFASGITVMLRLARWQMPARFIRLDSWSGGPR